MKCDLPDLTASVSRLSLKCMTPRPDTQIVADRLRAEGIQPSAQRVAVGRYVLHTDDHPTADRVWATVREDFPLISRATVYNTLNLFVEKGLLRASTLDEGATVFDANTARHHHFVDEDTGRILDIPLEALDVHGLDRLDGFEVEDVSVVLRGRRRR